MRCNPSYWLLGLVPIALLSWVAVHFEHEYIESDLAQRTQEAFERSGLKWAAPVFNGRDGVVAGRSVDEGASVLALRRARDVWGVRVAHGDIDLVQTVDRFVWSVRRRSDNDIVFSGYVPSDEMRRDLTNRAERVFPNAAIADRMKLARGAPDQSTWQKGAEFSLNQLAQLESGAVELDGLDLTIVGSAATAAAYRTVREAVSDGRPTGIALKRERITPPRVDPYVWTADYNGRRVRLDGYAPNERLRDELVSRADSVFGDAEVRGGMDIAAGAPQAWPQAAAIALDQLALLNTGRAEMRNRDLEISGEADDKEIADQVRRKLRSDVPRVFKLSDRITYPEPELEGPPGGYVMAIGHEGDVVTLTGYVPSEAARAALVDAVRARFPGKTLADRLSVHLGAPDGWQQCIVAGLAALPRLDNGKAELREKVLSVRGETSDYGASESVPADVRAAAGETCETRTDIKFTGVKRTDLQWLASRERSGTVLLQGEVPSEDARREIVSRASRAFPDDDISDLMKVVGAPSEPWMSLASKGLRQLARLRRGRSRVNGKTLIVSGQAGSQDDAEAVRKNIQLNLPTGTQAKAELEVLTAREREADRCEVMMRQTSRGAIRFDRASAEITRDSTETLNELADIANACPGFRIAIEGHTDSEGTDERNQGLSERRARAVADYLTDAGVARERMSTIGYGEARPIADNDTAQGRAMNRRIEFTVRDE